MLMPPPLIFLKVSEPVPKGLLMIVGLLAEPVK